ncbi:hypothetical protein AQUCO_00300124v1 [Aquilegia coerulea]|uniref:HTH myb-type domain-containing protein n=1 Tax=Aquilegia coerulea TaxID=218851 RepID=A0A2G5EXM2_AQUCA|nr:hypothetical protein AQUCO_00300124v1 [Aquilegia coerulea]
MRGNEERVLEWEDGLPNTEDLTPLSQSLISPELASAFSITPEPSRTLIDVNRASQKTFSSLRKSNQGFLSSNFKSLSSFGEDGSVGGTGKDSVVVEREENEIEIESDEHDNQYKFQNEQKDGSEKRKSVLMQHQEGMENLIEEGVDNSNDDQTARALKRPRLVWTPQLHKRFVDVVAHLGIKNAVPKTIMQLMNVEGLTRENVASHLQKYRLYLNRMQGLSNEGPSPSDQLFASTPVPPSLNESIRAIPSPAVPHPMPYGHHPLMPMPVLGVAHGASHIGIPVGNPPSATYQGFDQHHYNMYREQQRDWCVNKFNSIGPRHHVPPNNR